MLLKTSGSSSDVKPANCVNNCAHIVSLGREPFLNALTTSLKLLAKRWQALVAELNELDDALDSLTQQYAHRLRSQFGVGPQTAATLISVAGDNPERLKSESALAALCGVNGVEPSSIFREDGTSSLESWRGSIRQQCAVDYCDGENAK